MAPGVWNWGTHSCSCGGAYGKCPGNREPTTLCQPPACSEYHERVRTQGQQLQQLQAELDQLHKEVSSVRAANSEVSPAASRSYRQDLGVPKSSACCTAPFAGP